MTNKTVKNIDINFIFNVILKNKFIFILIGIIIFSALYTYENSTKTSSNYYSLKFNINVNFDEDIHIDNFVKLKTLENNDSLTNQLLNSLSEDFNQLRKTSIDVLINEFSNRMNVIKFFQENKINIILNDDYVHFTKKEDIFSKNGIVSIELNLATENNISIDLIEQKIQDFVMILEEKYQNYINKKFDTDSSRILSLFDTETSIRNNELLFYQDYLKKFDKDFNQNNLVYVDLLNKITLLEARLKSINFTKLNYSSTFDSIKKDIVLPKYEIIKNNYNVKKDDKANKIIPYLIFLLLSLFLLIIYEIFRNLKLSNNN